MDGFHEDCCKDSVVISMRILQGFQTILLNFYKDFYKDSKGFDGISMMILVGSLSGFWRISTGQAFCKNSTRISTMVPLGFKGVLKDFYMYSTWISMWHL